MSTIFEKIVSDQLCFFLQKNYIYEEFQSGFRPRHRTETALVKIKNYFYCFTELLLLVSDQGCILLLVLLDLSAAFDTIDHDILIDRLQNYTGIKGQALRWFRSVVLNFFAVAYPLGHLTFFWVPPLRPQSHAPLPLRDNICHLKLIYRCIFYL